MELTMFVSILSSIVTICSVVVSIGKVSRSMVTKEDIRPLTEKIEDLTGEVGKLKERVSVLEYIAKGVQ